MKTVAPLLAHMIETFGHKVSNVLVLTKGWVSTVDFAILR